MMVRIIVWGVLFLAAGGAICAQGIETGGDTAATAASARDMTASAETEAADPGERFELLYGVLKERYSEYHTDVMKTLAFLILAIGWFVTSDKSREFFRKTIPVRAASVATLTILAAIHIWCSVDMYRSSRRTLTLLGELDYLGFDYYRNYEITSMHLATNTVQNAILFIVLIVILFMMKKPAKAG